MYKKALYSQLKEEYIYGFERLIAYKDYAIF